MLSGTWKLAYTANSELLPLLALSRLPLTKVGDIIQVINASAGTFQNKVRQPGLDHIHDRSMHECKLRCMVSTQPSNAIRRLDKVLIAKARQERTADWQRKAA